MNIIQAIRDDNLFGPFLGDDLTTWSAWMVALRVLYGLEVPESRSGLIQRCTGRNLALLPSTGFDAALFLTGRRSGKSRIAAVIAAYEAVLAGHEKKLAKGETGIVAVCSPTKWQSKIVRNYIRGAFESPLLENEIETEDSEGFRLSNGVQIRILAGDWRTVRGPTLLAAVVDEVAFFGYEDDCHIRSDTELIRAIKPALATIGGKLICISSPYAKRGWTYQQHKRNFGNDEGKTLVWNCPSRTMNPTLSQAVVDDAMAEDRAAALAEYMGEFRDDISDYLPRQIVEALVVRGRIELMPVSDARYVAFTDMTGGRSDDAALAIAHRAGRKVVIDSLKRYRAPLNPFEVIAQQVEVLKSYGLRKVTGDNYAAEFVCRTFQAQGMKYITAEKNKSALYLELLPRLCSGEIELLDNEVMVNQISSLERRTRSGGRDVVDHPSGGHDDLANAIAGVVEDDILQLPAMNFEPEKRRPCTGQESCMCPECASDRNAKTVGKYLLDKQGGGDSEDEVERNEEPNVLPLPSTF